MFLVLGALALCILSLSSCGPARHLSEGEQLLNKVKINSSNKDVSNQDLKEYIKQEPNRQLLGLFKIYLGIYNLYYHKPESKIRNQLGEPPVIYDSSLTIRSVQQLEQYLNNRGYYNNDVRAEVSDSSKNNKKKVKVTYHIKKNEPYRIESIKYNIEDPTILPYFYKDTSNTLIQVGDKFDTELLQKERARISRYMQNNGFYFFSKEYIYYTADTSEKNLSADVKLGIKQHEKKNYKGDSIDVQPHQQYKLDNIYVRLNFNMNAFYQESGDTTIINELNFIDGGEDKFNKKALSKVITLRKNEIYQIKNQELTYNNISGLRIFQYISIRFEEVPNSNEKLLNVFINLSPRKPKSFTIETESTNSGGNLGINGSFTFQNNNTFKGAEILRVGINGGLEAQQALDEVEDEEIISSRLPFNTFEFGPEVSLEIPRFVIPFNSNKYSVKGNPRTHFNASYNYQERPDYTRNVSKIFIAYSWNETPTKKHIIQPFDFSYINLEPSPAFERILENINNPFIRNSYQDNLIMALKYSFIYNNQTTSQLRNSVFFRANAESAGNFLSVVTSEASENRNDDTTYNVLGIRYAQFVRTDMDFRYYQNYKYSSMVYRFSGGIGIPYGNSKALPFEKSFFAGGANGIRAWKARELGPGSLPKDQENEIDQIGNINLEVNLEYRFDVTNVIEGALFVDGGNIWELNQGDIREETEFKADQIWNDLAIGLGTGIRLDFNFFILRFDVAAPFKDPSNENPKQLKFNLQETNLNIGIGYPF